VILKERVRSYKKGVNFLESSGFPLLSWCSGRLIPELKNDAWKHRFSRSMREFSLFNGSFHFYHDVWRDGVHFMGCFLCVLQF